MSNNALRYMRFAVILMTLVVAFTFTGCGKSKTQTGGGPGQTPEDIGTPSVSGACYVFAGMSADDEEYDEALLKEIFAIQELSDYISVYFAEDGKAYVQSMIYDKDVVEGTWKQDGDSVYVDLGELDKLSFDIQEGDTLVTIMESDDDEFLLTLQKTDDIPEKLKERK